jgi:hypothetical protein
LKEAVTIIVDVSWHWQKHIHVDIGHIMASRHI